MYSIYYLAEMQLQELFDFLNSDFLFKCLFESAQSDSKQEWRCWVYQQNQFEVFQLLFLITLKFPSENLKFETNESS